MAELAKVNLAAAPGCPNCRNRLDLPLDKLTGGDEVQCLFCGEKVRIPQSILERLLAQREAQRLEEASSQPGLLQRIAEFFRRLFGG